MSGELDPRATGAKQIRNKICIITGAGQGIERATAKRLGEECEEIVVVDRIDEGASRTLTELRDSTSRRRKFSPTLQSSVRRNVLSRKPSRYSGRSMFL